MGTTGELSHPVPERACPRTPTENAESDDPLKLPHSIPEESHPRKSELVTSTNSDIAGKLTKETPSSCDRVATEATEQSKEVKSRRTVDTSNTPAATNTRTMRNNSVSSSAPNEPVPSEYGINARGVRKAPVKGKINDSPGNTRTNQATGTSGKIVFYTSYLKGLFSEVYLVGDYMSLLISICRINRIVHKVIASESWRSSALFKH